MFIYLRVKVDADEIGFLVSCDKWLSEIKSTGFIHACYPLPVHVVLKPFTQ